MFIFSFFGHQKKLEMRHRPLELQDISNSGQPKPRRRGMPKHSMLKNIDATRSKDHQVFRCALNLLLKLFNFLFFLSFILFFYSVYFPKVSRSMSNAGRLRTIGIHFEGDTSRYETGNHEHYDGNGRLRHPGGVFTDWKAASWSTDHGMERIFKLESGVVTIPENGLYYIYAQVNYKLQYQEIKFNRTDNLNIK